jgi:hypothetical protein
VTPKAAQPNDRIPQPPDDPARGLFHDALKQDRWLKRTHRALYMADPKAFRAVIAKARSRVLRMKPGPKDDPLVRQAAGQVARGARVEDVFRREFPHRRPGDEAVYAMALETFRGKVNTYIRKRPRLKRLRDRRKKSATEPAQPIAARDRRSRFPARDSASPSAAGLWPNGDVKRLTREQIQTRKDQAVRFTRDVVGDPERAEEIADESLEAYAERRGFEITNPRRRAIMPRKTIEDYRDEVADLKDQLADLEEENEGLQEQLDEIREILAPEEEEAESDEGDDDLGE